jgi:hypothetical protein
MSGDTKVPAYVEVPFHCSLPAFCPVCGAPAEKSLRTRAWEGIPLIFTYQLSISIPYCRSHYQELATLEHRQRLAVWGIFTLPTASLLPALGDWELRWLFWIGCLSSLVCLLLAFHYGARLSAARVVWMRTQGSRPTYLLRSIRPDWNQALSGLVDQFKKTHAKKV